MSCSELAGREFGFGVVVCGAAGARGMELISRVEARGRGGVRRGGCGSANGRVGGGAGVGPSWGVEEGGAAGAGLGTEWGCCWRSLAFSSQIALVAGSMGQADGGGSSAALAMMI